jgi:hypothetical protein
MKNALLYVLLPVLILSCTRQTLVNLTPDIISNYGLDKKTIQTVQCYYRSVNINRDSSVSYNEPTRFVLDDTKRIISDTMSKAASTDKMVQTGVIVIKNDTPCRIVDVLENGTVLRVAFSDVAQGEKQVNADFRLSYRTGYTFELISDTLFYDGRKFIRVPMPLIENIGLLRINNKELTIREIAVPGNRVGDRNR